MEEYRDFMSEQLSLWMLIEKVRSFTRNVSQGRFWIRKENKKSGQPLVQMGLITMFDFHILPRPLGTGLSLEFRPIYSVSHNWLVTGKRGVRVCFVFCLSLWLSHFINVQAGMSPFPGDGSDLTTVRPTPHAGNPSH